MVLIARLNRLFARRPAGPAADPLTPADASPPSSPPPIFPARPSAPLSDTCSLEAEDGFAVLVGPGQGRRPLWRRGARFPALREGWSVAAFHLELAPSVIISLRHSNGDQACWIVTDADQAWFEPVGGLPAPVRNTLGVATEQLLLRAQPDPELLARWNRIHRSVRLELLAETQRERATDPQQHAAGLPGILDAEPGREIAGTAEVTSGDDMIAVRLASGLEVPVLLGGAVLRQTNLLPGWSPGGLYCDFAPFYLLELRHAGGDRAAWLLDHRFRQIDDVARASRDLKIALLQRAAPVMNRHLESVLALRDASLDAVVARYLALPVPVRQTLVNINGGAIRPVLATLGVGQMPETLPTGAPGAAQPVLLRRDAATLAVTTDLHKRCLQACLEGRFEWPSPVDAVPAKLRAVFTLDDYVFVYQFRDASGLDFLLVAGDRCARVIGLVVPAANLLLFDDGHPGWSGDTWLRNERGGDFWSLLVRHVNHYADEMPSRGRTPQARPVNVLLSNLHIGHHLWNDLTGFEALVGAVPPAQLPATMILGAADGHAELFGPLERLFPLVAGRVDRSLADIEAFVRWTYRHDVWPARFTRDHVSAALRRRVMGHLEQSADAERVRAFPTAHPAGPGAAPVVVFGLRVEDRTFVDLPGFCEAFVAFMAARHPGAVIVFDGYNRSPGEGAPRIIRGMAYELARKPPEQVEAEIVAGLRDRFAEAPVTVVGTTGQSIATSLAWCSRADAAFALWGAGLAKYRWLANLPTMMISTRANLLGRSDLLIYTDARFTEAPAPFLFADASLVVDAGQDAALAGRHIQGGRECFSADADQLLLAFDALLGRARNRAQAGAAGTAAR